MKKVFSKKNPTILILSGIGLGFLPYVPGTWGSLLALPLLYLLISINLPLWIFAILLIILTIYFSWLINKIQNHYNLQDPSWIVMDEILGLLLVFPAFPSSPRPHLLGLISAFIIFRFFDIVKIFPANIIDKKIKNGFGTVFDDLVSGVYTGIIVFLLFHYKILS